MGRQREIVYLLVPLLEAGIQELYLSLPPGWQEPTYLGQCVLLLRCVSKELGWSIE